MFYFIKDLFSKRPKFVLKDGSVTHDERCTLIFDKDERSRAYRIGSAVASKAIPRERMWKFHGRKMNQGREGACVGFGCVHGLLHDPPPIPASINTPTFAIDIYHKAQRIDPWPGGAYPGAVKFYEGTSMLAGAKTLVNVGLIENYYWSFSEEEFRRAILTHGVGFVGTKWYSGMNITNRNGVIRVRGSFVGKHLYIVRGYNPTMGYRILNSWGVGWGQGGEAWISRKEMARLLKDGGEAFFVTGKNLWQKAA